MRAREFIIESNNIASAEQVWNYVGGIHPKDQQGGGFLKSLVMLNPQYELKRIPLSSLHIPDNPKDEVNDPYGRAMSVDVDHAREYSQHYIDKKPLVVDSQGHILDGAHRAWAAAELLNKTDIMAWVPVKSRSATPQDLELRKKFTGQGVVEGQLNEFDYEKHKKLINKHMRQLGYRRIGQGTDAQVFVKKDGPVIKILVPETGNISTAENTFLAFYNYCQKNVDNPHLPKFINVQGQHHSAFELDGERFRQVAMERLREVPAGSEIDNMVFSMMQGVERNKQPEPQYKNYMSFYKTLKAVMSLGKKLGFQNDIIDFNHSNVMQRNGVLVIVDPWVA